MNYLPKLRMWILSKRYTGDFYDADYFERGKQSGKGWLENYHWMPRRSFKEAFAFVDHLGLDESNHILDFGCAKGYLATAFRFLDIPADGCDISSYALEFAPAYCWNCTEDSSWEGRKYTHVVIKDVLEHLTKDQLPEVLDNIAKVAPVIMCVVPMGDNGVYRIPEYHVEVSHQIAESESWWTSAFSRYGWEVTDSQYHIPGLKDNWSYHLTGNCVFVLERQK